MQLTHLIPQDRVGRPSGWSCALRKRLAAAHGCSLLAAAHGCSLLAAAHRTASLAAGRAAVALTMRLVLLFFCTLVSTSLTTNVTCPDGWTGSPGGGPKCMRLGTAATHEGCSDACGAGASLACIQNANDDALAAVVAAAVADRLGPRSTWAQGPSPHSPGLG